MLPADRARMFGFYKPFSAFGADAEMAAWHYKCVFLLRQANQALFVLVLVILRTDLAVLGRGVVIEPINRLDFERHPVYLALDKLLIRYLTKTTCFSILAPVILPSAFLMKTA